MRSLTSRTKIALAVAAALAVLAGVSACGKPSELLVGGAAGSDQSTRETQAASPSPSPTPTKEKQQKLHRVVDPSGIAVYELPAGLKVSAVGWTSLSLEGDATYSANWGFVLENTRKDGQMLSDVRGKLIFQDAHGNKLGEEDLIGLGNIVAGKPGAASGSVDKMKSEPKKVLIRITEADWVPDRGYAKYYKIEHAEPGVQVSESGARVTGLFTVTNTNPNNKPIDVSVSALFLDKDRLIMLGGLNAGIYTLEPGDSKTVDVTGWGHHSQTGDVKKKAGFVKIIPRMDEAQN